MNKDLFTTGTNYIEIYVKGSDSNQNINTDIQDNKFYRILENVKKQKLKFFKKQSIRTCNEKQEHISEGENDYVYEFIINEINEFSDNSLDFITLKYKKKQKPTYGFPSNTKIYDIISNQRLTFKLNNLTYLNFQINEDYNGKITKEIFININFNKSCDEGLIKKIVQDTIKYF